MSLCCRFAAECRVAVAFLVAFLPCADSSQIGSESPGVGWSCLELSSLVRLPLVTCLSVPQITPSKSVPVGPVMSLGALKIGWRASCERRLSR